MSIRTRKSDTRQVSEDTVAPVTDDIQPSGSRKTRLSKDPAVVALILLIRKALRAEGLTAAEAGRDGRVVLVILPHSEWTEAAGAAWAEVARLGESGGRDGWWEDKPGWRAWIGDRPSRRPGRGEPDERFASEVSKGLHCAGFAADPACLPRDLVQAADYRLSPRALTGADVRALANRLCGCPATSGFPDATAAALTPRLLRLARRVDQTADGYLAKLAEVVAHEPAPPVSPSKDGCSPRAAPTLARLHGMDEAVAWGMAVARDLVAYLAGDLAWQDVDRGCLLSGPPGCGKTLFAAALASTCGVPLVTGSYGQWHGAGDAHQGDFMKALKATFAEARARAPCILFVDEIDSFPNRATLRHNHTDYMVQVVNAFLAEVDGTESNGGVVLLGACNHPEKLDPALVRSGRLDRHVRVGHPGRTALAAILREHLGSDLPGADLDAAALAASGATGADCERLVRGARRRARTAGRALDLSDLMEEIRGPDDMTPADRWLAAVHEAGHAVVGCVLRPGCIEAVSSRGTGMDAGFTLASPVTSPFMLPEDVEVRLTILMAGRAAEEEIMGVASSGAGGAAGSDISLATLLALNASCALGLDTGSGLLWRGTVDMAGVPAALARDAGLASRVSAHLDAAYSAARDIVRARRAAIMAVAAALTGGGGTLDGDEVEAIVARFPAGQAVRP